MDHVSGFHLTGQMFIMRTFDRSQCMVCVNKMIILHVHIAVMMKNTIDLLTLSAIHFLFILLNH